MTAEALSFQATPVITFGYVIQIIFSLAVIIGLMYLSAKYLMPKLKFSNTGRHIKLLDRIYLEPQVSACLIKVGRQTWLIGIGGRQITRIDKIDEADLNGS